MNSRARRPNELFPEVSLAAAFTLPFAILTRSASPNSLSALALHHRVPGIGLATGCRIVRKHGSDICAEGAVGKAFYFTLGNAAEEAAEVQS